MKTLLRVETSTGLITRSIEYGNYHAALNGMAHVIETWERVGWTPETSSESIRARLANPRQADALCVYVWNEERRVARVELWPEGCPGHPLEVKEGAYHYA